MAIDLIRHAGVADNADLLIELLRPSIRIHTRRLDREPDHDSSKFGGLPLLPAGIEWPTWDATNYISSQVRYCREMMTQFPSAKLWPKRLSQLETQLPHPFRPLNFVAELKLSELPRVGGDFALPDTGRLLFFYDIETSTSGFDPADRGSCRVMLIEDGLDLVRPTSPNVETFQPSVLDFSVEQVIPSDPRPYGLDPAATEDKESYKNLYESLVEEPKIIHRIAGYSENVQSGMELECELVTNGLWCGDSSGYTNPRRATLEEGAKDWRLLLQLDSDDNPGWMWGDAGRLYFWVRQQDLRSQNFDNIWCIQQCY